MDTPRRWQLASTATAVAGLSVGALMLGRPVSHSVEPIDLDRATTVESRSGDGDVTAESDDREIVRPRVIEAHVSDAPPSSGAAGDDSPATPDTPDSPASVDSADSVDSN